MAKHRKRRYERVSLTCSQSWWNDAGAAIKQKNCHLGRKFRHLAAQSGSKKKTLNKITRKLLLIIYKLMGKGRAYEEPIPKAPTEKAKHKVAQKCLRELAKLGYKVEISLESGRKEIVEF